MRDIVQEKQREKCPICGASKPYHFPDCLAEFPDVADLNEGDRRVRDREKWITKDQFVILRKGIDEIMQAPNKKVKDELVAAMHKRIDDITETIPQPKEDVPW